MLIPTECELLPLSNNQGQFLLLLIDLAGSLSRGDCIINCASGGSFIKKDLMNGRMSEHQGNTIDGSFNGGQQINASGLEGGGRGSIMVEGGLGPSLEEHLYLP